MCIRKKPRMDPEHGAFKCKSCGAVAVKKSKVCKPKKIKKA